MRWWIAGSLLAGGCESVFPLEPPPPSAPVQEAVGKNINNAPFTVSLAPTTSGNAVILLAVIATTGERIAGITDDAGNTWTRLLDGVNTTDMTTERVEIWYVLDAASITEVSLDVNRGTAVDVMEWVGLAPPGGTLFSHPGEFVVASDVTTGTLETTTTALVIGLAACRSATITGAAPATLASPEFKPAPFLVTQTVPAACGNAAFAVRDSGMQEVAWTLPTTSCTSGIVAIPID